MLHDHYYENFIFQNRYPRQLKSLEPIQGSSFMCVDSSGKKYINFSSSDYLGLASHPLLMARSQEYVKKLGMGSGSSRLVTGNFSVYEKLENQLAHALGKPAALILGAGYQTNISVLEALLDKTVLGQEPLVFCDRLCHVSLLASTRYIADLHRFQHNDFLHLERLLEKYGDSTRPKFIIVESIYSMDGDQTDLAKLITLAKKHHAFLYVDDAHAVGIYGKSGWGSAVEYADDIPLVMGTFSKALGSYGSYVGCSTTIRDYLINKCKGLIYSTAISPAILGAIAGVIELLPSLDEQRQKVLGYAKKLREFGRENGLDFGQSTTHIVPWIIGDAKKTYQAANLLAENGILALPIQPPSVPVGKSRIRICLSAGHSESDVNHLIDVLHCVVL